MESILSDFISLLIWKCVHNRYVPGTVSEGDRDRYNPNFIDLPGQVEETEILNVQ